MKIGECIKKLHSIVILIPSYNELGSLKKFLEVKKL